MAEEETTQKHAAHKVEKRVIMFLTHLSPERIDESHDRWVFANKALVHIH